MEILLTIATIIGGLAALWFFHEKLSPYYGKLFNDGFPLNYEKTDKEWCAVSGKRWQRIPFDGHYIVWDGPIEFVHLLEEDISPWSDKHIDALRKHLEYDLKYSQPFRVREYEDRGYNQLFESDCRSWRKEIIDRGQFAMMIQIKDKSTNSVMKIFSDNKVTPKTPEEHGRMILRIFDHRNKWSGDILLKEEILIEWADSIDELNAGINWLTEKGYVELTDNSLRLTESGLVET